MTETETLLMGAEVLFREAHFLDERRWDDWLGLYHEQAEFWVPAWRDEDEVTEDPENEIALIYISSRVQLEERVSRVRSGRSAASSPLPRTAHAVSNIMVSAGADYNKLTVSWIVTTQIFDVKRREQFVLFGRCEHGLLRVDGDWRIRRKKLVLLNDYFQTVIDFYSI